MSDDRPRPEYGEYATPEEQRARIQQPDVADALGSGRDPASTDTRISGDSDLAARRVGSMPAVAAIPTDKATGGRIDRIVAFVLLGYGLVQVVLTVGQLFDFAGFAGQFMKSLGIDGEFTNIAEGQFWSAIAAVSFVIGWVVTALVVAARVRRGKRVWWVPLVGVAITFVVFSVFLTIPLLGDPAIAAHFSDLA